MPTTANGRFKDGEEHTHLGGWIARRLLVQEAANRDLLGTLAEHALNSI